MWVSVHARAYEIVVVVFPPIRTVGFRFSLSDTAVYASFENYLSAMAKTEIPHKTAFPHAEYQSRACIYVVQFSITLDVRAKCIEKENSLRMKNSFRKEAPYISCTEGEKEKRNLNPDANGLRYTGSEKKRKTDSTPIRKRRYIAFPYTPMHTVVNACAPTDHHFRRPVCLGLFRPRNGARGL